MKTFVLLRNRPEFRDKMMIEQGNILPAQQMKLLNINAVAEHFTLNYDGPSYQPATSTIFGYRKSKKLLIQGLLDTLKNLFTETSYIRKEYDTKMGFVIGKY